MLTPTQGSTRVAFRGWAEYILVFALALGGFIIRAFSISSYAITHWDEGAYRAGAQFFATLGRSGVYRPLFSPPLPPVVFALSMLLCDQAVWASVLFGGGSIVLMYFVVKRLLSPLAASFAAAVLAVSGWNIMYSRLLLTESTYVFFLLAAIAGSLEYLLRRTTKWVVLTGLAVVALQFTKYNGSLASVPLVTVMTIEAVADTSVRRARLRQGLVLCAVVGAGCAIEAVILMQTVGLRNYLSYYHSFMFRATASASEAFSFFAYLHPVPMLVLASAGLLVTVTAHRSKAWALIHVALALYLLFLFRYTFYLRLLAPILVFAIIYSAAAVEALSRMAGKRVALACMLAVVVAVGVHTWRKSEWFFAEGRGGYDQASSYIRTLPRDAPIMMLTQSLVWTDLRHAVSMLPRDVNAVAARLNGSAGAFVVTDLFRFDKHDAPAMRVGRALRPYMQDHVVARIANRLPLEVLENNLSHAEITRLDLDQEFRDQVYNIFIVYLNEQEVRRFLAEARGDTH